MKFYTRCDMKNGFFHVRGYKDGKQFTENHRAHPYLFEIDRKDSDTPYRTLDGRKVFKRSFNSYNEIFATREEIINTANRECFGMELSMYPFLYDNYRGEIEYDPDVIRVANIDIEVAADDGFPDVNEALKPITAITMHCQGTYHVYGVGEYKPHRDDVIYQHFESEYDLIDKFIDDWRQINPDVITGWNVEGFDVPYIINRFERIVGSVKTQLLSPWGIISTKHVTMKGKFGQEYEQIVKFILGVSVLDYLALYKKFTYKAQENYRLDTIAFVELGDRKLDYSDHGSLLELYRNDYQKFIEYNIKDVEIVQRLEEKLGMLELIYALAFDAKVNFQDALTSVKMWDVIIHNYLMDKKIVVPVKPLAVSKSEKIKGGYVKEPIPGMYNWVCSFDLNSLYPHLIMQYNISPDTYKGHLGVNVTVDSILGGQLNKDDIQESLDKSNCSLTASGFMFTKNKRGFLPELMDKMYKDRKMYKSKMIEVKKEFEKTGDLKLKKEISRLDNMQMAKKIQLNSAYGALANEWFRWFNNNYAESITLSGQLSIRWIENKLNTYLNNILGTEGEDFIVAADTDSVYVVLDKLVEFSFSNLSETPKEKIVTFLDKVCSQKIEPFIENSYEELAEYVRAYDQKMFMKRECIADKGIWTAKKRYILNVYDNEGVRYKEPELKIMGIEAIKSSTPTVCRDYIKETLKLIMTSDEETVIRHITHLKRKFKENSFDDVAFPRSANNIKKYNDSASVYKKGTPIQVRGSLLYNKIIKDMGLDKKYQYIKDGDKIKFCYLKMPNPLKDNVISCASGMPREVDLDQYIDYNKQFEKGYLEPVKTILNSIGWEHEKRNTLPFL